jgi:hypothetical protein
MTSDTDARTQLPHATEPRVTVAALDPALTAGRGAAVDFVEQEAENAATDGTIIGPDTAAYTLAAEASGRMAVKLDRPGQYVEFTLTAAANAVTIRYSIPDAPGGGGIEAPITLTVNARDPRSITLTSRYSWFYGLYPFTNDPDFEPEPGDWKPEPDPVGKPFRPNHFYDELRVRLDLTCRAGDRLRLTMPEGSPAAWYVIDVVDFELVEPPAPAPEGSLSVVDFGADPAGGHESSDAFDAAIAAARASGSIVFIPAGTYQVNRHIVVDEVTIAGAGNWWSIVRGREVALAQPLADGSRHTGAGFYGRRSADGGSHNVHLADFAIEGDVRERIDLDSVNGIGGALSDSTIERLYIHHTKVGIWVDGPLDNLTVRDCVIVDTMADGLNFCVGVTSSRVVNCFFRNNGDDGLAMWSRGPDERHPEVPENARNLFDHNTVQTPILANCIAIYGGREITVSNNLVADPIREGSGLHAGRRFWSTPLAGYLRFTDNTVVRAGTLEMRWGTGLGAIWFYAQEGSLAAEIDVSGDRYLDSVYHAIVFHEGPAFPLEVAEPYVPQYAIANVHFTDIQIDGTGAQVVSARVAGSATFRNVVARNVGVPGIAGAAEFEVVDLGGNEGDWLDSAHLEG